MKKALIIGIIFLVIAGIAIAETGQGDSPDSSNGDSDSVSDSSSSDNSPDDGMTDSSRNNSSDDSLNDSNESIDITSRIETEAKTQTETRQENEGVENQVQNVVSTQTRTRVMEGDYTSESGQTIRIEEQEQNRIEIRSGNHSAETELEIEQERYQNRTRLTVRLSNGANADIKIMPDTASQVAIQRLRLRVCSEENNCTIELKEVGVGNQTRAAYEVQAEKQARLFGIFGTKMRVQAEVDAENGFVLSEKKPWWAFLASEQNQ